MKKILTLILAIALMGLCVTGCSTVSYDVTDSSAEVSEQERSTTSTTTTTTTTTTTVTTTTTTSTTTTTTTKLTTTTTQNNVEDMVWIPQSGSKYHSKANCSNMKNPRQVSKSKAIGLGYGACKKCYK